MRTADSTPRLRADTTSFVGRRAELAQAQSLLHKARLLTLVGPGGIGKTRLAFQIARTSSDEVHVVELGDASDHESVVGHFAAALGVPGTVDAVLGHLSRRTALLVVDTCEHVAQACGRLVRDVLLAAPRVRVLATGQEALGVEGEHLLRVGPLPIPATITDGRTPDDQDAVTLLTHRVTATAPDFEPDYESRSAILDICRELDGVPLALEFVAAWFRVLPAEDIVRELSGGARLSGGPGRPERQRTQAAALEWSHRLCTPAERALADHLSVFRGGFTIEAAAEIARVAGVEDDDELLKLLAGLVDKSVVVRDSDQSIARYRILEPTRKLIERALAASGRLEQVRRAHRDHFLRMAERFQAAWSGPGRRCDVVAVMRERANVLAALEHSFADPAEASTGTRLVILLQRFWLSCGFTGDGLTWAGRAASVPGISDADRAVASGICAVAAGRLGDHRTGERFAEDAVRLARHTENDEVLATVLRLAGLTAMLADEHARALDHLTEACALTADATPVLAIATLLAGDADRVIELARAHLARAEHLPRGQALHALAMGEWRLGRYEQAAAHATDSMRIMHHYGDVFGLAALVELMSWIAASTGAGPTAGRLLGVAENMWQFAGCTVMFGSQAWIDAHHDCVTLTRNLLGKAELRRFFSVGLAASSSIDRAVSFTLKELQTETEDFSSTGLTAREVQLARLIAGGASNKEISSTLNISPRTTETHVRNILKKLGFTSRVQIVTWVVQHTGSL
ncbi:LuxR C-terminal-related transcriptional regulator [Lentzea sp. BCCO 10_0061]|uniref:LuxR C-terminal-related transcriptional regulator n=1 Tax=Lentzea sokolovensis TaxID=3095429 RepID=A0ABU4VCG7_9PSEU|nr:LuxR C-terminal-related transcriptional regulator [Lentzea sp. BCCO 10_0061]MDX8149498.1 LuxR C-terminal-related transcriptional regulator [Lentzea sp. BCCO 10_0061]